MDGCTSQKSRGLWLLLLLLVPFTCTYLRNNTTPAIENLVNNREQSTTDTKLSYPTGSNSITSINQPVKAENSQSAQQLNNAEKNKVRKKNLTNNHQKQQLHHKSRQHLIFQMKSITLAVSKTHLIIQMKYLQHLLHQQRF